MTLLAAVLIAASLFSYVAGQLLLKRAMQLLDSSRRRFGVWLAAGIASMTVSFFLTLGLMQRFELSYLYPFQGLSVIIVSIASALLLRERLTLRLTIGALLISAGIVLVSVS